MWTHNPLVLSEWIWAGVMLIPLIILSIRYAHARNKLAQQYAYAITPTEQYFHCFHYLFQKDDEELNKKWDANLKDTIGWQKTLCIYKDPKDYKEFVRDTMIWKEKNWAQVKVKMTGAPLRIFFINILFFGFLMYPLIIGLTGAVIKSFGLAEGEPTGNLMGLFTIIFGIIIFRRCLRIHRSTQYHYSLIKTCSKISERTISDYDETVRTECITDCWSRRGYYLEKMCMKYFDGNPQRLVAYAANPANIQNQRLNLAQRLIDNQIGCWFRKPVINDEEADEDDEIGFADTEDLMLGMFYLLMFATIIGAITMLGMLTDLAGIAFGFVDWILHLGQNIGG